MIIKKAELETVAVKKSQYPEDNMPEVAFAGRSNVGKSSLLNLLTNRNHAGALFKIITLSLFPLPDGPLRWVVWSIGLLSAVGKSAIIPSTSNCEERFYGTNHL